MRIEELWVGTKVKYPKYGEGVVIFVDKHNSSAEVKFENNVVKTLPSYALFPVGPILPKPKVIKHKPKPISTQPEIEIGYKVYHSTFGSGKIINYQKGDDFATIDFDSPTDGKKQRTMSLSYLKIEIPRDPNNVQRLTRGDAVYHEQFGKGIVLERKGISMCLVRFEKTDREEIIPDSKLSRVYESIIEEDEFKEEEINSDFRVLPANYSAQSCYSTEAKRLLTFLRKKYSDGGIATIQSFSIHDSEIGVLIVPTKGIIVFKMFNLTDDSFDVFCSPTFETFNKAAFETFRQYYLNKFLMSTNLCVLSDGYKILKYPVRFVFLYQNIDLVKFSKEQVSNIEIKNKNILFKNFTSHINGNELFSSFEPCAHLQNGIDYKDFGSIIERVIPENATLVDISPAKFKKVETGSSYQNPTFFPINGKEREFKALCLDDLQIKMINDTKAGYHLTLANPGTGKSVLLVSKAYRLQSMNPNSNVLITCFNKNLAQRHAFFSETSGMKTERMYVKTFHGLIWDYLSKYEPSFLRGLSVDDEFQFSRMVDRFDAMLYTTIIRPRFDAIFIDEIQLFEPRWIDICYRLLDRSDKKDYFFEMYGDVNQDVNSLKSKGKAPWQNTKTLSSFTGRVRKLDVNYRNTDIISNYLNAVISSFNKELTEFGLPIDSETACLTSKSLRTGSLKVKIMITPNNKFDKVIRVIKELKAHAEYNEIAIIYPATKFNKFYSPVYKITTQLDENDIPYNFIHGDENEGAFRRQKLYDCDGVIMTTIASSMGLDFKYVIFCGLHYWDFIYYEVSEKFFKFSYDLLYKDRYAKEKYSEIGKSIYTACSRARDGLYIIDDLDSTSPVKKILRPRGGGKYYDEK